MRIIGNDSEGNQIIARIGPYGPIVQSGSKEAGNVKYASIEGGQSLDTITLGEAIELLKHMLVSFEKYVDSYCRDDINQNQFDALVSFAYNLGPANLKNSTLLKKVNANPNDPTIKDEFLKWNKAAGKPLKGLTKRRESEANLYFS